MPTPEILGQDIIKSSTKKRSCLSTLMSKEQACLSGDYLSLLSALMSSPSLVKKSMQRTESKNKSRTQHIMLVNEQLKNSFSEIFDCLLQSGIEAIVTPAVYLQEVDVILTANTAAVLAHYNSAQEDLNSLQNRLFNIYLKHKQKYTRLIFALYIGHLSKVQQFAQRKTVSHIV